MRFPLPTLLTSLVLIGFTTFVSCRKQDKLDTSPGLSLSFSADTVYFDTVFSTIGSVTQRLTVYNRNDHKVSISSIRLAGGENSDYRLNIDGMPVLSTSNLEISGHDSIFILVRITVDPNEKDLPFVISDSIIFLTNGNNQDVKLVAWGQNARFIKNGVIIGTQVWDSLKPWVVYGSVRVDTGASLTIQAGAKVYFHMGSSLFVSYGASLRIGGTLDHKVIFRGDRLDPYYRDLPGQWKGIYLERGTIDNAVNYAVLENGTFGFSVDSLSAGLNPVLTIDNTIIQNMTSDAIYAYATSITGTNLVFANCGGSCIYATNGGSYEFRQITLANYWFASVRFSPALYLSNFTYDTAFNIVPNPLVKAFFGNSIIYGALDDEVTLDSTSGASFNYTFDHCLLRTLSSIAAPGHFISCIQNEDPLFVDPQLFDFHIDSLSPAIGQGADMGISVDLDGVSRGLSPDLGAYQWVPVR